LRSTRFRGVREEDADPYGFARPFQGDTACGDDEEDKESGGAVFHGCMLR
jgi:hypothetical protein